MQDYYQTMEFRYYPYPFVITYTTYKLQPLDRGVFLLLESYFNKACQKWKRNHSG